LNLETLHLQYIKCLNVTSNLEITQNHWILLKKKNSILFWPIKQPSKLNYGQLWKKKSKEIWRIWFIMGKDKIIWSTDINEMKKNKSTWKLKSVTPPQTKAQWAILKTILFFEYEKKTWHGNFEKVNKRLETWKKKLKK